MDIEKTVQLIYELEDKDYNFSAMNLWEEVLKNIDKEYYRFRYADTLRLCGFFKKAEKVLFSIDINNVPLDSRYSYFMYLGQLYIDQHEDDLAKNAFEKAIELNPDSTVPYILLNSVLSSKDEYVEDAITNLKIALTKSGDIDEVNYNLARLYLRNGKINEALQAINCCLELDPQYPSANEFKSDLLNYNQIILNKLN